jgi:hypothetical protein
VRGIEAYIRGLAVCRRESLSRSVSLCYTGTYEQNVQNR